jgi:hypothetical protein
MDRDTIRLDLERYRLSLEEERAKMNAPGVVVAPEERERLDELLGLLASALALLEEKP